MISQDTKLITNEKLEQAKTKLILENPYFGTLAMALEIRFNTHIASFRPLGDVLEVNDEYLEVLSVSEEGQTLKNHKKYATIPIKKSPKCQENQE